ncbi:MAG: aspartate/glutamate racemase family protein [Burkholderiales bacterium]|nr:aspartate/glutamate racemase family protein [Burkholderiales bacterium]
MLGILGGMGPAATVSFLAKIIALTPASRDQEHIPMIVANLPQIPDRSSAILGTGPDPLPSLLHGIAVLNEAHVGLIAIPCNSSHYWYDDMTAASAAPLLHIARVAVAAIPTCTGPVAVLATRGLVKAAIYQRALESAGLRYLLPDDDEQDHVDGAIRDVKGGELPGGGCHLQNALDHMVERGASAALLACTELPLAAEYIQGTPLKLVDTSLELARACVNHAVEHGWNRPT